jgi:tungstate transport system substrate-binding protein
MMDFMVLKTKRNLQDILLAGLLVLIFSVTQASTAVAIQNPVIRLATTTSTDNSGLLTYLLPKFKKDTGYEVHVIAVGTGKALRLGRDGDVDVVLVHAPGAEQDFVNHHYGIKRYPVMYNDFVIIGNPADPAGIKSSASIIDTFSKIKSSKSLFVSRGDDSGTHKKEKKIWQSAALDATGSWYREAGQGMGKVIQIANELGAYTLTDRGTWLSYKGKVNMDILYEGDAQLFNPYGIIAVNDKRYSDINIKGANALIEWITSKRGQQLIGDYKKFDQVLFVPSAEASSLVKQ